MTVDWDFGPDDQAPDDVPESGGAGRSGGEDVPRAGWARRSLIGLAVIGAVLGTILASRALENMRLLARVEKEVSEVVWLEQDALEAGDLELLLELQGIGRRGDARLEAIQGHPLPLAGIELAGESTILEVRALPAPSEDTETGGRTLDDVEVMIQHQAVASGLFTERRRYSRDENGLWRHARIKPPRRSDLVPATGTRWLIATVSADDMEYVIPALVRAEAVLDEQCARQPSCPQDKPLVQLRFSGSHPGRITNVMTRSGRVIALPSPSLTIRPADAAGAELYAQQIARIALLGAAGLDVTRGTGDDTRANRVRGVAPHLRTALYEAWLATFDLWPEPIVTESTISSEFGSLWDLWWPTSKSPGWSGPASDQLDAGARNFVETLLEYPSADPLDLLLELDSAESPESWLDTVLKPFEAAELVSSWPEPPPLYPGKRSMTFTCGGPLASTWRVSHNGEPIELGPACGNHRSALGAAWSTDGNRIAITCEFERVSGGRSEIRIVDSGSLNSVAMIPNIEGRLTDVTWAENGRLVWSSRTNAMTNEQWAWPEDGAEIHELVSEPEPTGRSSGPDARITWGADGERALLVEQGGAGSIRMIDIDRPETPLWSARGYEATWDGEMDSIAILERPGGNSSPPSEDGPDKASDTVPLQAGPSISIVDSATGRSVASRSLSEADIESMNVPEGHVPHWVRAALIGITSDGDRVGLTIPISRENAEGRPMSRPSLGRVVSWSLDEPSPPSILAFDHPITAEWLTADHPDAPSSGEGAPLYVVGSATGELPTVFKTGRTSGEIRVLGRFVDQFDPDREWRIRMAFGRVEMRRAGDDSLAWWFNKPYCARFRWQGDPTAGEG